MSLLQEIKAVFGVDDLYEVFGVEKSSTTACIKQAYRKKSLLCHPDKAPSDKKDEFTKKFQTLCKSFDILQDDEKRKIYDETGAVDDETLDSNRNWEDYWRNLFPRVTEKQIDNFMKDYIGSDKERADLKRIYEKCKGDMNKIAEFHLGYFSFEHEDRVSALLNEMIESDEIVNYPAFSKESAASKRKRRRRHEKEAEEAEQEKSKSTDEGLDSLALMILGNQRKRASDSEKFIADLEAKYAPKPKRRSKGKKQN